MMKRNDAVLSKHVSLLLVSLGALHAACGTTPAPQLGANMDPNQGAAVGGNAGPMGNAGASPSSTMAASAGAKSTATITAGAVAAASGAGASTSTATAGAPTPSAGATASNVAGKAGSGGAAGAVAAAGSGGAAGMPASSEQDYGTGDGSDVVTIGDSWMSIATNGGGIEGGLDRAMTKYRHYSIAGTQLLNGQIPSQYDQAKRVNPKISTVILTGGGNDVMFTGGCTTKESCTQFAQRIADGLNELYTKMVADGVTSTVYIQYSRNAGTSPAETRPDTAPVPAICTTGKLRCVGIDTTDLIGPTDTIDGIHPTFDGCDRIAKRVLETMAQRGVRR